VYNSSALKALLDESGVAYKQNYKSFILTCPRCQKKEKLYLRKEDGRFVCWRCKETEGFQGRPEFALVEIVHLPLTEIRARLYGESRVVAAQYLDIQIKDFFAEEEEVDQDAYEPLPMLYPPDFFPIDHQSSVKGAEYLAGRGIDMQVAKAYDLYYCPSRRRVIFPVKIQDRVIGWQDRYIGQTEWYDDCGKIITIVKALTATNLKRDRCLMFGNRLNNSKHCVLTEGPVDALKAHLCGGNVATMGKAVSAAQINLIRNSGAQKIYLALDPDAYLETKRLVSKFSDLEVYDMRPPVPFKDIGEMSLQQVQTLFNEAPRVDTSRVFVYTKDPSAKYKYRE